MPPRLCLVSVCVPFRQATTNRAIVPTDGPLTLQPSCGVFHYAQCLFEGLKAYRDENGVVTMFRPDMNMKRMNTSAKRISLPVSSQ
jgi:branched-subunit amino acid aminotransferase/4-amino-4-deoxychorismate lyase